MKSKSFAALKCLQEKTGLLRTLLSALAALQGPCCAVHLRAFLASTHGLYLNYLVSRVTRQTLAQSQPQLPAGDLRYVMQQVCSWSIGSPTSTNSISFRVSHCMLQIVELEGFADKNSEDDMFSIVFLICSESAVLYHNMVVLICTRSCTSYR